MSKIAGAARLGYRKTLETLHDLRDQAKVISIEERRNEGTKERDESVYVLLSTKLPSRNKGVVPSRTSSYAENPKDSPKGESIEKNDNGGSALEAQPPNHSQSKKPSAAPSDDCRRL